MCTRELKIHFLRDFYLYYVLDRAYVIFKLLTALVFFSSLDDEEDVQVFPLINLIQHNHKYYRYQGGLTTPPCSEVVQWTIFRDTIRISKSQVKKKATFRFSKETYYIFSSLKLYIP